MFPLHAYESENGFPSGGGRVQSGADAGGLQLFQGGLEQSATDVRAGKKW